MARRVARVMVWAALPFAVACDLGKIELPAGPSQVVIHGVLSATAPNRFAVRDNVVTPWNQSVLVERILTGEFPSYRVCTQCTNVHDVDGGEPIITDGGVPERDAVVDLTTPSGQTIIGHELTSIQGGENAGGAGVYVFDLAGSTLVPGGKYQLHIVTWRAEVITAETIVPQPAPVLTGPLVAFNRSADTLALTWPSTPASPAYLVRVESPYGAWWSLTDSTHVALTGELRSFVNDNLPHVFIPGFRQILTVSAVDANMYDYYRSTTNSFTGLGIVSHVKGALGFFGSLVIVSRRTVDVTAPTVRPIEGTFDLDPGSLGYIYGGFGDARSLRLYVEATSARKGQPDAISASFTGASGSFAGAAVGTFSDNRLSLVFLRGQSVSDTLDILTAQLHGDTLVGTFSKGAPAKYIRR